MPPFVSLNAAALSDPGLRRPRNEDAYALEQGLGLAVVADGMGGHPAGDDASRLAIAELVAALSNGGPGHEPTTDPRTALGARMAEAVQRADSRIRAEGASDPGRAGMGTTLTAVQIDSAAGRLVVGHV